MIWFYRDFLDGAIYVILAILSLIFIMAIIGFIMERLQLEKEEKNRLTVLEGSVDAVSDSASVPSSFANVEVHQEPVTGSVSATAVIPDMGIPVPEASPVSVVHDDSTSVHPEKIESTTTDEDTISLIPAIAANTSDGSHLNMVVPSVPNSVELVDLKKNFDIAKEKVGDVVASVSLEIPDNGNAEMDSSVTPIEVVVPSIKVEEVSTENKLDNPSINEVENAISDIDGPSVGDNDSIKDSLNLENQIESSEKPKESSVSKTILESSVVE